MIEFEWPWVFAFLPLPVIVYLLVPAASPARTAALRVPALEDFKLLDKEHARPKVFRSHHLMPWLVWVLLIVSGAQPIWYGALAGLPVSGRNLLLAVDLSDSMKFRDFIIEHRQVDRLTAAKWVVGKFIERRKGERMGLVVFGEQASLYVPLTFDTQTLKSQLEETRAGMVGGNTAIGDAIGLAIKQLRSLTAGARILVLLTDGENTAGALSPMRAAELAKLHQVKIYTIGLGKPRTQFNPDPGVDEESLAKIAAMTGGQFFMASNTLELNKTYDLLDKLEQVESDKPHRFQARLYYWGLGCALLLTWVWTLKQSTRSGVL